MRDIHMAYDEEGDILYITFGANRQASTVSLNDNIVLRYDLQANEAVGITIIGFSDLLTLEREGKQLPLRNLAELPNELGKLIKKLIIPPPANSAARSSLAHCKLKSPARPPPPPRPVRPATAGAERKANTGEGLKRFRFR